MRQTIIITVLVLITFGCEQGGRKDVSSENGSCDFNFQIIVESSNTYEFNSEKGHLKKLINPFKEEKLYADTTFFISKASLCELLKLYHSYGISKYPKNFRPDSDFEIYPEPAYHITFNVDNQKSEIHWTRNTKTYNSEDAYKLHKLLEAINSIILTSEEFKHLPEREYEWL